MNYDSSRTGQKPVFLRGGKDSVNIEKHDNKQLKIDEDWYQDLIEKHPSLLLTEKFGFEHEPISIGTEYETTHGKYIDNLLITRDGRIVFVEDKLLKNESSRRVIAQTIDYAQDLQKWSYEDLEKEFKKQKMNTEKLGLYEYVNQCSGGTVNQYDFVQAIEKNLKTAAFLILIVGDKIHNDTEYMAAFMNQHTTMNFQIGLIEIEVYITDQGDWFVVPYLTTKTQIVEKMYVRVTGQDGQEDLIREIQVAKKDMTETIDSVTSSSSKTAEISDEALFNAMEEKGSIEIREGIQSIIDDIRNNQLDGYIIIKRATSFCIYLRNVRLARPISILNIFVSEAWFDPAVCSFVFKDSNIDAAVAEKIFKPYRDFLSSNLNVSIKKLYMVKSLANLVNNKVAFFAELRRLAKEIDEAVSE